MEKGVKVSKAVTGGGDKESYNLLVCEGWISWISNRVEKSVEVLEYVEYCI